MNTTTNTRVSEAMVRELKWALFPALENTKLCHIRDALEAALSAEPAAQGEAVDLRVEVRQCDDCDHVGINDCSDTTSACHDCEWQGPTPDEDKCPGCGHENCMAVACPECGGRYRFLADRRFAHPAAPVGVEPVLRRILERGKHRTDGDLATLLDRVEHMTRGDQDLIAMQRTEIRLLDEKAAQPAERVPEVTFDMMREAEHLCPSDLPHLDKLRWKASKITRALSARTPYFDGADSPERKWFVITGTNRADTPILLFTSRALAEQYCRQNPHPDGYSIYAAYPAPSEGGKGVEG